MIFLATPGSGRPLPGGSAEIDEEDATDGVEEGITVEVEGADVGEGDAPEIDEEVVRAQPAFDQEGAEDVMEDADEDGAPALDHEGAADDVEEGGVQSGAPRLKFDRASR